MTGLVFRGQVNPIRADLFRYLWENRHKPSSGDKIWHGALKETAPYETVDGRNANRVRDRIRDLKGALLCHAVDVREGWRFDLRPGIRSVGWQLEWKKVNDPQSLTRAFWKAHLDSECDTAIVYIEELFLQDWVKGYSIRYHDCNAERSSDAILELQKRHPEIPADGLKAAYPFVAWGEVEARDLITRWFAQNEMVEVEHVVTRRENDESKIWQKSLILLGAAPANRMIAEALNKHPNLPFRMEDNTPPGGKRTIRVFVNKPTKEELRRFAPYNPVPSSTGYTLDYNPDQGTLLAILTRVPNLHAKAPITILNSDFGRAIEQMAHLLTHEPQMRNGKEMPAKLSEYYQILFGIPIGELSTGHRHVPLTPLAFRSYRPSR